MVKLRKLSVNVLGIVLAAATLSGVSQSWACGPTRNKHMTTIEIDAPPSKVWEIVGNYADFGWTGKILRTDVNGGLVPLVAHRRWTFASGATFTDQLSTYDPKAMTIAFMTETGDVSALPVSNYASRISVREDGDHSTVEWRSAFVRGYPKNDPPPEFSDEAAVAAVTEFQQAALENLKRTLEAHH